MMLTVIATLTLLNFVTILVVIFKVYQVKQSIYANFQAFVTAPDDKTPSPLAQSIESMSQIAGRAIAMEVKTTLMGKSSGIARQEQGMMNDIVSDQLTASNPILSGILDSFPSLKKRLVKNPQLAMAAAQIFSKVIKTPGSQPEVSVGSNGNKPKFNL